MLGRPYLNSPNSNIHRHFLETGHSIDRDNFKILKHCENNFELKTMESIFIHAKKPSLNNKESSTPLNILQSPFGCQIMIFHAMGILVSLYIVQSVPRQCRVGTYTGLVRLPSLAFDLISFLFIFQNFFHLVLPIKF